MKPTPPLRDERAGEHEHAGERYILRHGGTLYRVTAASASLATADVLAFIGDPSVWRGELEVWNETYYRQAHGDPDIVVDVPDVAGDGRGDGACAACIGTGRESGGGVCPACDGTGEAPDNASVGEPAGWIVRVDDRAVEVRPPAFPR